MVGNSLVKWFAPGFAGWFLVTSMLSAIMPTVVWAQQANLADFESPIIEHQVTKGGGVGGVEVFGATVVDNVDVDTVSLFYRFTGESQFAELQMREVASSSYYSTKVDTANVPNETDAIEYYIQAKDTSGNIVLKGFAFQPLNRVFLAQAATQAAVEPSAQQPVATSSKVNWVYVALGALVVGGVIAASQGDDETGGDECVNVCTVTINIPPP